MSPRLLSTPAFAAAGSLSVQHVPLMVGSAVAATVTTLPAWNSAPRVAALKCHQPELSTEKRCAATAPVPSMSAQDVAGLTTLSRRQLPVRCASVATKRRCVLAASAARFDQSQCAPKKASPISAIAARTPLKTNAGSARKFVLCIHIGRSVPSVSRATSVPQNNLPAARAAER